MVVHRAGEMILFCEIVMCILSSSSCIRVYYSNGSGFANSITASSRLPGSSSASSVIAPHLSLCIHASMCR